MFVGLRPGPRFWESGGRRESRGIWFAGGGVGGVGKVVGRDRGGGCLLAFTLVALQGRGLGAELPEHGLHAPLEIQLSIWAAGAGEH